MAIMTENDRNLVRALFGEDLSEVFESINLTKSEVKAAVDALDQYLSDNGVSINNTLPEPAKTNLTKQQKARLLALVVLRRYEVDI